MKGDRQKEIEKEAFLRSDPEFLDEIYIDGFYRWG